MYHTVTEEIISSPPEPSPDKRAQHCYGTILYLPSSAVLDFGPSVWPQKYDKRKVCPQILLVQVWTDGRFGLPGGRSRVNESPIETMNREFQEEVGTRRINFDGNDYSFSFGTERQTTHFFLKIIHDEGLFRSVLIDFHFAEESSKRTTSQEPDVNAEIAICATEVAGIDEVRYRKAYINEIFSVSGFPLFIEGPENASEISWTNNVWGLPRQLISQGGGFLTPTLKHDFSTRSQLLVLLVKAGVIPFTSFERIVILAEGLAAAESSQGHVGMGAVEEFLAAKGIREVLRSQMVLDQREIKRQCLEI